jgi:hypothetical protein
LAFDEKEPHRPTDGGYLPFEIKHSRWRVSCQTDYCIARGNRPLQRKVRRTQAVTTTRIPSSPHERVTRKGIDDALDAFGVHGVGGTLGALLTGVFASAYLNESIAGNEGIIHGGFRLMGAQLVAVATTAVYTLIVSFLILKVLDLIMGLRVTTEEEQMGLDLTQHGESAYSS